MMICSCSAPPVALKHRLHEQPPHRSRPTALTVQVQPRDDDLRMARFVAATTKLVENCLPSEPWFEDKDGR
ncbi:hypothetical protein TIFTF001_022198 [Ficus carica]|uniref:Uncharacterized protein n=1 Tax=Ficus carica TaxID=3494 RepID=A0AA88AHC1_FICCA|nr:hypothetical protein TIFTF001_022198 [Ficus carica]